MPNAQNEFIKQALQRARTEMPDVANSASSIVPLDEAGLVAKLLFNREGVAAMNPFTKRIVYNPSKVNDTTFVHEFEHLRQLEDMNTLDKIKGIVGSVFTPYGKRSHEIDARRRERLSNEQFGRGDIRLKGK